LHSVHNTAAVAGFQAGIPHGRSSNPQQTDSKAYPYTDAKSLHNAGKFIEACTNRLKQRQADFQFQGCLGLATCQILRKTRQLMCNLAGSEITLCRFPILGISRELVGN